MNERDFTLDPVTRLDAKALELATDLLVSAEDICGTVEELIQPYRAAMSNVDAACFAAALSTLKIIIPEARRFTQLAERVRPA